MRTRRSPRNQALLWRALGGPPAPPPVAPTEDRATIIRRHLATPILGRTLRRALERELAALEAAP